MLPGSDQYLGYAARLGTIIGQALPARELKRPDRAGKYVVRRKDASHQVNVMCRGCKMTSCARIGTDVDHLVSKTYIHEDEYTYYY